MLANPPPPENRVFAPLKVPVFRAIWLASMASNIGGLIQSVGASWMMTSLTSSPALVALVQASTTLPIVLVSLFAGALADNHDRRQIMLGAQSFMLMVSVLLAACAYWGALSPWLLLGFTFLIGIGTALNAPAWQASVGDMVPRAVLPGAITLNGMGFNVARSFGPALGGAIVAIAGAAAAFLANAVSYVGLIVVLARWQPPVHERTLPPEPIAVAMGAGLRYVAMSPEIRTVLFRAAFFGLAASAIPAMMPLVARHMIAGGAFTYGVLLGGFGFGAVLGVFGGARIKHLMSTEALVGFATAISGLGTLIIAFSHNLILTFVALLLAGSGWVLTLSTLNVTVQMASPRWVVGRSLALYQMSAFGGMALGSWLCGEIAAAHGVSTALLVAGVVQLTGLALGYFMPVPAARALDLNPLSRWHEPTIAIQLEPRSGPIVITIDYRIAPENVGRFLAEMAERRRIRLRDGARHWTLLRDLEIADMWIERYHVATWNEYIRHNERRTQADAASSDRINALQREGVPIVVHRRIERQTGSLPRYSTHDIGDVFNDPTRSS